MHFDRMDVGQPLQPEFRDPAVVQFIVGAFGVFGEDETVKAVAAYSSDHPRPRSGGPTGLFGDRQVIADLWELWFVAVGSFCRHPRSPRFLVVMFVRTTIHEPCFRQYIKRNLALKPSISRNTFSARRSTNERA